MIKIFKQTLKISAVSLMAVIAASKVSAMEEEARGGARSPVVAAPAVPVADMAHAEEVAFPFGFPAMTASQLNRFRLISGPEANADCYQRTLRFKTQTNWNVDDVLQVYHIMSGTPPKHLPVLADQLEELGHACSPAAASRVLSGFMAFTGFPRERDVIIRVLRDKVLPEMPDDDYILYVFESVKFAGYIGKDDLDRATETAKGITAEFGRVNLDILQTVVHQLNQDANRGGFPRLVGTERIEYIRGVVDTKIPARRR